MCSIPELGAKNLLLIYGFTPLQLAIVVDRHITTVKRWLKNSEIIPSKNAKRKKGLLSAVVWHYAWLFTPQISVGTSAFNRHFQKWLVTDIVNPYDGRTPRELIMTGKLEDLATWLEHVRESYDIIVEATMAGDRDTVELQVKFLQVIVPPEMLGDLLRRADEVTGQDWTLAT